MSNHRHLHESNPTGNELAAICLFLFFLPMLMIWGMLLACKAALDGAEAAHGGVLGWVARWRKRSK